MAELPTPEQSAREVLNIFAHYHIRPGQALQDRIFVLQADERHIAHGDLVRGVDRGVELGWFERGPRDSLTLTASGFAQM